MRVLGNERQAKISHLKFSRKNVLHTGGITHKLAKSDAEL